MLSQKVNNLKNRSAFDKITGKSIIAPAIFYVPLGRENFYPVRLELQP